MTDQKRISWLLRFLGSRLQRRQRRFAPKLQLELLETRTVPSGLTVNFSNLTSPPNPSNGFFVAVCALVNGTRQHFEPGNGWVAGSGDVHSYPLAQFGTSFTIPDQYFSGIMVIFAGQAVDLFSGGVAPDPTNPRFANTPYELVEFTTNGANSSIDTSQVDQFAYPLMLTLNNQSVGMNLTASPPISRGDELSAYTNFMSTQTGGSAYNALEMPSGSTASSLVRIENPGKYLAVNPFISSSLQTTFDPAIQALFQRTNLHLTVTGTGNGGDGTYTGNPATAMAQDRDGNMQTYNVLQFTGPAGTLNVFEPFFSNSAGTPGGYAGKPLAPKWLVEIGPSPQMAQSPGSMVFQCNGVFADEAGGANSQGNNLAFASIELQLVAALNRGVSNLDPSLWTTATNFYPGNGQPENLYAKFVHKGMSGSNQVFINGLAYGFAYDEGTGGGPSKIDFDDSSTPTVRITLGSWLKTAQRTFAVGSGAGAGPGVKVFNADGSLRSNFNAYDPAFLGGVRVAMGDVNGDGVSDLITAPGPGGGPLVQVFSGVDGSLMVAFNAYDPAFRGGLFVASADLDSDGKAEIITAPDAGGGPLIEVFNGSTGTLLLAFNAYNPAFLGGVHVAAGDVNGDEKAEIITAPGFGGGPLVEIFNGQDASLVLAFNAYDPAFHGGVFVAIGDVTGDGKAEIITGTGVGAPHVKVFDGLLATLEQSFFAFDPQFQGGARVATTDVNHDNKADLVVGEGPTGMPAVLVVDALTLDDLDALFAYDAMFHGGVFVGGF